MEKPNELHYSKLPGWAHSLALKWRQEGARVAARLNDAHEVYIMKLRFGESPWYNWMEVVFDVRSHT